MNKMEGIINYLVVVPLTDKGILDKFIDFLILYRKIYNFNSTGEQ